MCPYGEAGVLSLASAAASAAVRGTRCAAILLFYIVSRIRDHSVVVNSVALVSGITLK